MSNLGLAATALQRRYGDPNAIDPQTGVPRGYGYSPIGSTGGTAGADSTVQYGTPSYNASGSNYAAGPYSQYGVGSGSPFYENQNAGDRRVGSGVNYSAFGNLQNAFSQNPALAAQARQQGLVPSYNGIPLDQIMAGGDFGFGVAGSRPNAAGEFNPFALGGTNPQFAQSGGGSLLGRDVWNTPAAQAAGMHFNVPSGAAVPGSGGAGGMGGPGGVGGGGGMGAGSVPRTGLPLEGLSEDAYARLIGANGGIYSPFETAAMRNRNSDTVNRGTQDALDSLRIDAIRRGIDPSSLASQEAEIRARGADSAQRANLDFDTTLNRENFARLMQSLGGAGGLLNTQIGNIDKLRELQLLAAQVANGNSPFTYLLGG